MTEKHLSNQRFTDFELDPSILRGIEEAGFEYCTPIQAETLPHLLAGRDVAGQAKTGTGKTAAFLVALFQHLLTHPAPASRTEAQPRALVLAPTRELAIQIDKDARIIGRQLGMKLRLIYGGTGYESQRRDLQEGVDVLIGTPGRIIDYLKQGIYSFDGLQVVVLDEADRMFDLGFIKDIRYLFRKMPAPGERLNMLFSATLSLRVNELAYEHMNSPEKVTIESDRVTVDQVTQKVFFPSNTDKLPLLLGFLKRAGDTRTLVFMNTKHQSERVATQLQRSGLSAGVLSGDVPQKKRERLLERFKAGEVNVLVATDVAARGLHIPDVSLVVNYDLPQDPEDYVHRIGRTARAGAAGDAVSFACETYAFSLPDIEDFIGQKIEPASYDKGMLVKPGRGDSSGAKPGRGERTEAATKEQPGRRRKETGRADQPAPSAEGGDPGVNVESPQSVPSATRSPAAAPEPEQTADAVVSENAAPAQDEPPRRRSASSKPDDAAPSAPRDRSDSRAASGRRRERAPSPADEQPATAARAGYESGAGDEQDKPGRKPQRGSHEIPAVG
ncbi:MAG: ATP-dependent RNA helicase RhlB [Gammaproteobacteria bacterium]|nr:ATP-dependent RNA helicase RhlB [Gammaproteobacteria bacterium]